MYKVNIGSKYPAKYGVDAVIGAFSRYVTTVSGSDEVDFFLFPILYEILFEYNDHEYKNANFTKNEIESLKTQFQQMVEAAVASNKKIIIFYYRDPVKKIEVPNAVVFRTSLLKSKRDNEYAMPAYVEDMRLKAGIGEDRFYLEKSDQPTVGFRGQAAPIVLPIKLAVKRRLNSLFRSIGINKQINLYYNFGYLARRDAVVACSNNKNIKSDLTVTTAQQSVDGDTAKQLFLNNIFNNQYNICVSGHGNYSFRLYEALSAGRIPVFINTDCVLPFEEFIDWKKHVVWIEEKHAYKADEIILKFHRSINPGDFLQLQKSNRLLWEQYLCPIGFFENLHKYLDIIDKASEYN